jgi:hypothetical protein
LNVPRFVVPKIGISACRAPPPIRLHLACFAGLANLRPLIFVSVVRAGPPSKTVGRDLAFIQSVNDGRKKETTEGKMNETKIASIELGVEIEELETKIAPSGAATLGDL